MVRIWGIKKELRCGMGEEESKRAEATGGSCVHYELFDGDLLEISGSDFLPQAYITASGIKAATAFTR